MGKIENMNSHSIFIPELDTVNWKIAPIFLFFIFTVELETPKLENGVFFSTFIIQNENENWKFDIHLLFPFFMMNMKIGNLMQICEFLFSIRK